MKVNDIVKYGNRLFKIVYIDTYPEYERYNCDSLDGEFSNIYVGKESLQFISTYKDYLKDEIIKGLNEIGYGEWEIIGNSKFTKLYCYSKNITFTDGCITVNTNIPLSIIKQIIEFFEIGDE